MVQGTNLKNISGRTEFDRQCEAKKRERQRCPTNLLIQLIFRLASRSNNISFYTISESTQVVLTCVSDFLKLYQIKTTNHFPTLLPIYKHQFYIQLHQCGNIISCCWSTIPRFRTCALNSKAHLQKNTSGNNTSLRSLSPEAQLIQTDYLFPQFYPSKLEFFLQLTICLVIPFTGSQKPETPGYLPPLYTSNLLSPNRSASHVSSLLLLTQNTLDAY